MRIRRTITTLTLSTLALVGMASTAHTDAPLTRAEASASRQAGALCRAVPTGFREACWLGSTQWGMTMYRYPHGVPTVVRARTFTPGTCDVTARDVAPWATCVTRRARLIAGASARLAA